MRATRVATMVLVRRSLMEIVGHVESKVTMRVTAGKMRRMQTRGQIGGQAAQTKDKD